MSNLVKQVYHGSVIKPVIAAHQKQTVDFSFIFLHQSPLFQAPLDRVFFFIFNAPYSSKFPSTSLSTA